MEIEGVTSNNTGASLEIEEVDMAIVRLTRREATQRDLPEVCILCGERADEFRSKTMYWHSDWVFLLILLSVWEWPFIIHALFTQQRMRVQLPFCCQHRGHWSVRAWTPWLSLAGILVLGMLTLALKSDGAKGMACIGCFALLAGWIVLVAVLSLTAVRPKEIKESSIMLKGVHPRFIDALEEYHDSLECKEPEDGSHYRNRGS